jgi:Tol biopolymer transport system component
MISGKRAFHGETTADTMSAILKEETPELAETARSVPPGLERIVRHCLEKHPTQRFQSAGDLAFDLEALTEISAGSKSGAQAAVEQTASANSRRLLIAAAGVLVLVGAAFGLGLWVNRGAGAAPPAEYKQITFRTGAIGNARFTPDGSIVYSASWEGGEREIYLARPDDTGSREVGLKQAELLSVSKSGELAIRLNTVYGDGFDRTGTLARVPLGGGKPRELLENVQDAEWAADGENLAVVRYVPENHHWRLEFPIGHALLDGVNWISSPKISADGQSIAFAAHENPNGDDRGSIAVVDLQGHEKKLSSGWSSIEGLLWSPAGDEIWFTASSTGGTDNLRGVNLAGKLRSITNVPGGMWLQDLRNGVALAVTTQTRLGIRGVPPGGKEEHELGWLGWAINRDISRDGKKVLFEEESDGGGPNYTVFLRDTDGTQPVRIGEGNGLAISPDGKWVITKPANGGPLSVVPTGAGEARQLTHDNVGYNAVRYLPDGKQLLGSGIESGHGARDYLIDVKTGDVKPLTPEGVSGAVLSPDGTKDAVTGPDGNWAVWPLDGSGLHPVPGLDSKYGVVGWSPDSNSIYAVSIQGRERILTVYRVNPTTGEMEPWKKFGEVLPSGATAYGVLFSADGSAYAYSYVQILSAAYVVKGLK